MTASLAPTDKGTNEEFLKLLSGLSVDRLAGPSGEGVPTWENVQTQVPFLNDSAAS